MSPSLAVAHPPAPSTKISRYALVTSVAAPTNLILYLVLLELSHLSPVTANLVAASVITPPTYLANRRWVWGRRTAHSLTTEVLPYWLTTLVNVVVASTTLAALDRAQAPEPVLGVAPLAVYALLWLVRYAVLDLLVFTDRRAARRRRRDRPLVHDGPSCAATSKPTDARVRGHTSRPT